MGGRRREMERAERAHLLPSVRVPQTSEYHIGQMIRWPCRGSHATPSKINQEQVIRQVRNAAKTRRPTGQSVEAERERREGNIWQRKWSGVISLGISLSMGHQAEPRAQRITPLEGTTILSLDDLSRVTRHKAGRIWQSKVEYTDPRACETPCIAFGS